MKIGYQKKEENSLTEKNWNWKKKLRKMKNFKNGNRKRKKPMKCGAKLPNVGSVVPLIVMHTLLEN